MDASKAVPAGRTAHRMLPQADVPGSPSAAAPSNTSPKSPGTDAQDSASAAPSPAVSPAVHRARRNSTGPLLEALASFSSPLPLLHAMQPDDASQLSVPLTLLTMHATGRNGTSLSSAVGNGSQCRSRDTSPLKRECSVGRALNGGALDADGGAGAGTPVELRSLSGSSQSQGQGLASLLPPPRASELRASIQGGAAGDTTIGGSGGPSSPHAGVPTSGGASMSSSSCSAQQQQQQQQQSSLPLHLCTLRPPTPLTKEEDLMASLRSMSSPSKRRSRFASPFAERVGSLDVGSPSGGPGPTPLSIPGSPRTDGGGGDMRSARRATLLQHAASSGAPASAPLSPSASRAQSLLAGEPAPWTSAPSRSSSLRRGELGAAMAPVPEEPMAHSRGDAFPSSTGSPSPSPSVSTRANGRRSTLSNGHTPGPAVLQACEDDLCLPSPSSHAAAASAAAAVKERDKELLLGSCSSPVRSALGRQRMTLAQGAPPGSNPAGGAQGAAAAAVAAAAAATGAQSPAINYMGKDSLSSFMTGYKQPHQ